MKHYSVKYLDLYKVHKVFIDIVGELCTLMKVVGKCKRQTGTLGW